MENLKEMNGKASFEERLQQGDWWRKGNECLNVHDIHRPPVYYKGSGREWIEELTAYIYSYPVEWSFLYEEYLQKVLGAEKAILQFYRSDDGYLRHKAVEGVYLRVTGCIESLSHEELNCIGQELSKHEEELFKACLEYSRLDEHERSLWSDRMEKYLQCHTGGKELSVTVVDTLDESEFFGKELYFDMLNDLYMIL